MVSQAAYHAHHADAKRPGHSYSPYMPTNSNRYTENRVYVPNNDHRGLLGDSLEKTESTTRKRIAVACGRCRQRKIRCSGDKGQNLPCTNCQSAGVTPCLFLRVSSREATIKADFDYNTEISRALANRSSVPLPPPPPLSSSNNNYGTVPSDFSPGVSNGSGGGAGDPYRSTPGLYPYNHKAYYNSLPPSPWTSGYNEDCGTSTDYSAPQPCGPYAVVSDQTSQLAPPFTWDGRTPAGPPPPPLTLKVQAPSSAPTLNLNATSVSLLPPPLAQSHSQGHPQDTTAQAQNASHCHCHNCVQGQGRDQGQGQTSSAPVGTPKQHVDLGPVPSQVPSQDHDASQYDHGELVYRPGLTGGSDADVGSSSDFHQASTMQSALARTSMECLGRLGGGGGGSNSNSNSNSGNNNNDSTNNDTNTTKNCGNSGSGGSAGCEATIQAMQAAVPMSRAPSRGSVVDHGASTAMPRFKQEMMSSRSNASSPGPMQSSMQAHLSMAALPPLPLSSHASHGHIVNTASPASSPYASGHVSAANSAENLARVNYSTTPVSDGRPSSVTNHSYGPKTIYHDPSLYVSASSVAATPVSERANDGSIFSDQERDVVGTQGPGPVACLDSYTYGSGPNNGPGTIAPAKVLTSSSSSSSLHGVYGRQNKKKSSTDSLAKTRPYSPAEGPMLPPSHHHSHGHAYMGSSRQPSTPVCDSPLLPPPNYTPADLQVHDVKTDPGYEPRR